MPAYPWLFEIKDSAEKGETAITIPDNFMDGQKGKVIATKDAKDLLAYLLSLKQTNIPDGRPVPLFLYPQKPAATAGNGNTKELDGGALYATYCQTCHQANGEGLKGAFPPLKGSSIVNDANPKPISASFSMAMKAGSKKDIRPCRRRNHQQSHRRRDQRHYELRTHQLG